MRRIDVDGGDLPDPPIDPEDPPDPGNPDRPPPALQTWSRLEPLPLTPALGPGLQAAVADPLWLLARQWQFLEFAGEDAGTPIEVHVTGEAAALSRYLPSPRARRIRGSRPRRGCTCGGCCSPSGL